MQLKKLQRPWSSGFPSLPQVLLHQVHLQPQGFPSRWCGSRRRRAREFLSGTPPTYFTHIHFGKDKCNQLPYLALVQGVTNPLVGKSRDKVTKCFHGHHNMWTSLYVYGYPSSFLVGLTNVGIERATHSNGLLQMIYINIEHPHLQHPHEVILDKTQG